jgi:hypothetical protein
LLPPLCVAVAFALAAPCALAQAPAQTSPAVAALEKAVAADPTEAVLTYLLSVMRARAGDAPGTLQALEQTMANGDGFLPPDDMFESLQADRRFKDLRSRFAGKLPRVVTGSVVATLTDDRFLIPEGIAYDASEDALYVGSIARKAIYRLNQRGKLEPLSLPSDELDFVLGVAVDPRARKLYAVSTSALTDAGRSLARNAIVVYDLKTRRRERSYPVPGAVQLNDVAIGENFVLATDSSGGGVWRIALADGKVDALVPLGRAPGANGIAITGDGRAYIGASRRPLRLDIATGEIAPLRFPPREQAAGIDGLYWFDGFLVGVQNVTNPGRVVRLTLGADGATVTRVETLQSHHQPAFVEPTTAAPSARGLYVLARTYVGRFDADGKIAQPESVRAAQVLRIPWPTR